MTKLVPDYFAPMHRGGRTVAVSILIAFTILLTSCMSAHDTAKQTLIEPNVEVAMGRPGIGGKSKMSETSAQSPAAGPLMPPVATNRAESAFDVETPSESGTAEFSLLIIKTADVTIKVKDIETAGNQVVAMSRSAGGFVSSSSFSAGQDDVEPTGTMTIRVPVYAFDSLLARLGRLGEVKSKNVSGEDVTGQVSDLESRLRNKRAEEAQYIEIMQKAKRIADIVNVSNQLFRVRGDIEQLQGRIKYLRSASDMSTITITLEQTGKDAAKGIPSVLKNALASLKQTSVTLLALVIWLAVYAPYWLAFGALVYYLRKLVKARRV